MFRRDLLTAAPTLASLAPGRIAAAGGQPILVELFTSQSCSSCPPADVLLGELAGRPDVLALSFHVTYWNRLGWRDRFSLAEATERQRRYAMTLGHNQIYTPQAVIQGRRDAVGSNRAAIAAAIRAATPGPVLLALREVGPSVSVGAGAGEGSGTFWLIGYDRQHVTPVASGENRGRTLTHSNVVRSLSPLGEWRGEALNLSGARPAGERVAVLLQASSGSILGLATL
jgi:hypothetical protein